jgi:hypothetical protein
VSYAFAVWYSDVPMGPQEALTIYHHLGKDWVVVRRRPEFEAFWQELLSRLPDLQSPGTPPHSLDALPPHLLATPDEIRENVGKGAQERGRLRMRPPPPDNSPWASDLRPMGSALSMAISGSYIKDTVPILLEMTERHGLIAYDPQTDEVFLPSSLKGSLDPQCVAVRQTLQIHGSPPSLEVRLILDGRVVFADVFSSRAEAHARSRAIAIEHGVPFYEVDDPVALTNFRRVQVADFSGDFESAVRFIIKGGPQ